MFMPEESFSDYIVYVDESGNLGLGDKVDKEFPLFVLAFCIFKKTDYAEAIVPELKKFKFRHWGHDLVNLHEREIRKSSGHFAFLSVPKKRERFLSELSKIIKMAPFTVIATVIQKKLLSSAQSPYFIAMKFCLERLSRFLEQHEGRGRRAYIIFEQRGRREDQELELEFRRTVSGENFNNEIFPFEIQFATKQTNCAGIQLADMIARPIGLHVLRPQQINRAFSIIKEKLYRGNTGGAEVCGLEVYPK